MSVDFEARYQAETSGASYAGAYLIGLAFAFGWTPCVGPILATVLALAANEASLGAGLTREDEQCDVHGIAFADPASLALVERSFVREDSRSREAAELLRAAQPDQTPPRVAPVVPSGKEPLSEREVEVLRLLATDLTGPEISSQLFMSVNTFRTHTRHIFTKLDVKTRRAAVSRAQDLRLV